jgi:hypothetical protein
MNTNINAVMAGNRELAHEFAVVVFGDSDEMWVG